MIRIKSAAPLALVAALSFSPVRAQVPTAIKPTTVINLFDGRSLANFETWLVDHHSSDPSACSRSSIKSTVRQQFVSADRCGAGSSPRTPTATTGWSSSSAGED